MKIIKLIIISAVVLFGILTAISSLLPSKVRISRAVDITGPPADIMAKVRNMNEWDDWNEYTKTLPDKNITTDSIHSTSLSVSIVSANSGTVTTNWHQQNKNSFPGIFVLTSGSAHTTVQWYFEFAIKWYPWEKFGSIIYDKQLGPEMEKSLQNLKSLIEKAP